MSGSTTPTTGNSVLPPPRLTGQPDADNAMMQRWLQSIYQQLIIVVNVQGAVTELQSQVTTLQQQVASLDARVTALGG